MKRPHPPGSAALVEAMLDSLPASLPALILRSHKNLSSLANSIRGLYMRQHSEAKRVQPAPYTGEQFLSIASFLRDTLSRETRISVRSFGSRYLPILDFPRNLRETV